MKNFLPFFIILLSYRIDFVSAAIFKTEFLWDKTDINVCFYDNHTQRGHLSKNLLNERNFKPDFFTHNEKKNIKELIQKNFTKNETKIVFTGWENCSKTNEIDTIIVKAKPSTLLDHFFDTAWKPKGRSTIGNGGFWDNIKKQFGQSFETTPSLALNTKDRNYILHEFGHLAGLLHEHEHPDSVTHKETNCTFRIPNQTLKTEIPFEYDSTSIMNYCYILKTNRTNGLSKIDIATLNLMY